MQGIRIAFVVLAVVGCTHPGASPPVTVVRVDPEPPGANCASGGVAIHTGLDQNHDGVLEDGEITSTQYVCNAASTVACPTGAAVYSGTATVDDLGMLAGITCIDGDLIIAGLAGELPSLPELQTVTGEVVVAGNANLTSLDGFLALTEVGQSYLIQSNAALTDISSIAQLDKVLSIWIVGNDALQDLAGLSSLNALHTGISVSNNGGMTSLHGFENIVTISGGLIVDSNRSLTDLGALASLRSVAAMDISGNATLPQIALPSLEKVSVRLLVNNNPALIDVSIPKLVTLSDALTISGNPTLASVSIPSFLTAGTLNIQTDPSLTTLDASGFEYATVDVNLSNLTALTSVNFTALSAIGGTLRLSDSNELVLSGFDHLMTTGGLWVVADQLTDFSGLSSLQSVEGDMTVANCPQLTSFAGLNAMTSVGGNLVISQNPQLPLATAQTFASSVTVKGSVTIN